MKIRYFFAAGIAAAFCLVFCPKVSSIVKAEGYVPSLISAKMDGCMSEAIAKEAGIELSGDVVIPETLTIGNINYQIVGILDGFLMGNENVTSISIPEGVKEIGSHAFDGCRNLRHVSLPEGLEKIGSAAFQLCTSLEEVNLPEGLVELGGFGFNHCSGVQNTEVYIPASVELLGDEYECPTHMFYNFGTEEFTKFAVSEESKNYATEDGILYSKDIRLLVSIPRGKEFNDDTYVMPDSVEKMGELSFSRNQNIRTVVISDNLEVNGYNTSDETRLYNNLGNDLSVACYVYNRITAYEAKDTNPNYSSENGVLYSKDYFHLVAVPNQYEGILAIHEGTRHWDKEAIWTDLDSFEGISMNKITEIKIPSSIEFIDEGQIQALNHMRELYGTVISLQENIHYALDGNGYITAI